MRNFCYLKKKEGWLMQPSYHRLFHHQFTSFGSYLSSHTATVSTLPSSREILPVACDFTFLLHLEHKHQSPDKTSSSHGSSNNAVYKHWQYCTYFIGKKNVESQKKCHKSNQHASRSLTEPLQEPWFGLTCDFNMLFSAAAWVRELLKISQKCNIGVKGESIQFQNKSSSFVSTAALQRRTPCLGPKLSHTY